MGSSRSRTLRACRRAAAAATLSATVALLLPVSALATGPGANGLLVLGAEDDIATVEVGGGNPTNITRFSGDEVFQGPAVSLDGSRLAFGFYDGDPGQETTLTSDPRGQARLDSHSAGAGGFLPDGRLLGIDRPDVYSEPQLFSVEPDGLDLRWLTSGGGTSKEGAVAAPDGKTIYFVDYSFRTDVAFRYRLLALDVATGALTEVTSVSSVSGETSSCSTSRPTALGC